MVGGLIYVFRSARGLGFRVCGMLYWVRGNSVLGLGFGFRFGFEFFGLQKPDPKLWLNPRVMGSRLGSRLWISGFGV